MPTTIYQCDFCRTETFSSELECYAHEQECLYNPATRGCNSCHHLDQYADDIVFCAAGLIPYHRNCEKWKEVVWSQQIKSS